VNETKNRFPKWLWISVLSYAVVFSLLSIAKHEAFNSTAYDLGIYDQVIWKYSNFYAPYSTILEINHLGDHFSLILIPLVPLYWIWPSVHVLLILQSLVVSLVALPMYRQAMLLLSSQRWAKFIVASYFLNAYLHRLNLFDFHPVVFELLFVFIMIVSIEERRPWAYWTVLPFLLMTEDDAFVSVLSVGLYAFFRRERRTAAITWGLAVIYGVLVLQWVQPWINEGHPNPHTERYAYLGKSFLEMVVNAALHPLSTLSFLLSLPRIGAFLGFLAMPAFLPLLGGWSFLLLIPPLSVEFLSSNPQQFLLRTQYSIPAMSFLYISSIYGIMKVKNRRFIQVIEVLLVLIPLTQIPTTVKLRLLEWPWNDHVAVGHRFLSHVPANASLATQSILVPHLSQREDIFLLPKRYQAEYILIDTQGNPFPMKREELNALQKELPHTYDIVAQDNGYTLWKRKPSEQPRSP